MTAKAEQQPQINEETLSPVTVTLAPPQPFRDPVKSIAQSFRYNVIDDAHETATKLYALMRDNQDKPVDTALVDAYNKLRDLIALASDVYIALKSVG